MVFVIIICVIFYAIWFVYSSKYATLQQQVPWRRAAIRTLMVIDKFIFETCLGMKRKVHFSLCPNDREGDDNLKLYASKTGHCWCFGPHHLLFPSFILAFHYEAKGLHARMGVVVDEIFSAAASVLFYIPILREIVVSENSSVDKIKLKSLADV
jgi:hypothetical protein